MITIKDIIMMIYNELYCKETIECNRCTKYKFCRLNTKFIALEYLYRGCYYG